MKSFGNWTTQELRNQFGLDQVTHLDELAEWIAYQEEISENEKSELQKLRIELDALNEAWNEDELKMHFIAPLMHLIHYGLPRKYNAFYQRNVTATVQGVEMNGVVDMVVAKGWESPATPYFFLHEYKQEEKKGDARAQLLAAMLTAQTLNQNEKPLFGVYLIGASWRFVVIKGLEYAVARFDATKELELLAIFQMLKWIKNYVEKDLGVLS